MIQNTVRRIGLIAVTTALAGAVFAGSASATEGGGGKANGTTQVGSSGGQSTACLVSVGDVNALNQLTGLIGLSKENTNSSSGSSCDATGGNIGQSDDYGY